MSVWFIKQPLYIFFSIETIESHREDDGDYLSCYQWYVSKIVLHSMSGVYDSMEVYEYK